MISQDTICAISTPPGNGAISIIRMSGEGVLTICKKVFFSKSNKSITFKANRIYFGTIKDKENVIDEVLLSYFKAPNSYTGEDIVEISCHGSIFIQQQLLQLLINNGARTAKPGEFTLRAFLNGKIDLSQAEGVADLIASSSAASHNIAINQMRGGFSSKLSELRSRLLNFISLIELELDFSEEDVEFVDRNELMNLIDTIASSVKKLLDSFVLGNVLKNGVPVAIIGNPNVGKSTLLNTFLNENKAIVSEIPGTTRDYIEDTINIRGILFRFIDTAGIRKTSDTIENLGIEKTFEKINQAKVILLLVDADEKDVNIKDQVIKLKEKIISKSSDEKKIILVVNKIDKLKTEKNKEINVNKVDKTIFISAKFEKNIDELIDAVISVLNLSTMDEYETILTNTRHVEALTKGNEAIKRVTEGLKNKISTDFLAMDIREILHFIGEITGEVTTDEILGNIFSKFCIGK